MRRRQFLSALSFAGAALTLGARRIAGAASELQDVTLADGLGVTLRLTELNVDGLQLVRSMGFRWLRTDVPWAQVERQPGNFDFLAHRTAFALARNSGFRVLGILDYGHPVYTEGGPPATGDQRARFADYAQAAERELGGLVDAWEVWNEPNYKGYWAPAPNASDFGELVRNTSASIWALRPDRQIVAGGLAGADTSFLARVAPFLADVARGGPLAASLHPYRAGDPESFVADLAKAHLLGSDGRAWAAPGVPLWVTEWGYCRLRDGLGPVGQASMDARIPLVTASLGIPVTVLFELVDPRAQQTECGHSYGLYESGTHRPHPAAVALQDLLARFGNLSVRSPGLLRDENSYGLRTTVGDLRWASASGPVLDTASVVVRGDTLRIGGTGFWVQREPSQR